jgi:hypothetical protein
MPGSRPYKRKGTRAVKNTKGGLGTPKNQSESIIPDALQVQPEVSEPSTHKQSSPDENQRESEKQPDEETKAYYLDPRTEYINAELEAVKQCDQYMITISSGASGLSILFLERATRFELVTSSLGSWHSTAELRPQRMESISAGTVRLLSTDTAER